ncbi:hypothetical protein DM02DRAFT_665659 [Periconia macrospinosa]|uniref:Uncharacterized protein n=1 Tax=Periconia macrospinosa TaxID=97972 RepID=A0A2V1CWE2_9PLEO|nr:hypothetical protein DM02DRAFT_665659 [Periconia macrospinosa]
MHYVPISTPSHIASLSRSDDLIVSYIVTIIVEFAYTILGRTVPCNCGFLFLQAQILHPTRVLDPLKY